MDRKSGIRAASQTSIEIDFYFKGVRCKERIKKQPSPRNLAWAEKFKNRIELEIAEGTFNYAQHFPNSKKAKQFAKQPGDTLLLKFYLEDWLQSVKEHLKASTWDGYRKVVRGRLIPAFGELKLSEFKRKHAKDWVANSNISTKSIANIMSPLRVALDDAEEDELIDANPLAGWKIKRRRGSKRKEDKIDPFTYEEQTTILNALEGQNKNMVQFWLWTGLRPSELIALVWSDVDWINGRIYINKALTQVADEPEDPKTEAGEREVLLLPQALEALNAQKCHTYTSSEEIFQNPKTGKRWKGDQPIRRTMWIPALIRAGVRYRYPYQCRHTYASMMLMNGEHPMWVANQMGHTTWVFTASTYSRFIPANAPEAGKKASASWSAFSQQTPIKD